MNYLSQNHSQEFVAVNVIVIGIVTLGKIGMDSKIGNGMFKRFIP